jgi:hypothetical protein
MKKNSFLFFFVAIGSLLLIWFKGEGAAQQYPMSVTPSVAKGTPDISVSPDSLDFGEVDLGKKVTKTLTITNTGTGDLQVTVSGIEGTDYSISGKSNITIKPKKSYKLKVTVKPSEKGVGIFEPLDTDETSVEEPSELAAETQGDEPIANAGDKINVDVNATLQVGTNVTNKPKVKVPVKTKAKLYIVSNAYIDILHNIHFEETRPGQPDYYRRYDYVEQGTLTAPMFVATTNKKNANGVLFCRPSPPHVETYCGTINFKGVGEDHHQCSYNFSGKVDYYMFGNYITNKPDYTNYEFHPYICGDGLTARDDTTCYWHQNCPEAYGGVKIYNDFSWTEVWDSYFYYVNDLFLYVSKIPCNTNASEVKSIPVNFSFDSDDGYSHYSFTGKLTFTQNMGCGF